MNREQLIDIMKENGVEDNKALARALLNAINEEKRNLIVETTNKVMDGLKDYKSPEEYKKLEDELLSIKEAENKRVMTASFKELVKEAGYEINDKWVGYMISQIGDHKEKERAEKVIAFIKENPELVKAVKTTASETTTQQTTQPPVAQAQPGKTIQGFGNTQSQKGADNKAPQSMEEAVASYYNQNK